VNANIGCYEKTPLCECDSSHSLHPLAASCSAGAVLLGGQVVGATLSSQQKATFSMCWLKDKAYRAEACGTA